MIYTVENKKALLKLLPFALMLLLSEGCSQQPQSNSMPSSARSTTVSCTEMSAPQRNSLIQNLAKIKIGDQDGVVISVLGNPLLTDKLAAKESDHVVGTHAYYFVRKCGDQKQVEDSDQYVRLFFYSDGRLGSIESFGVAGVNHRSDLPADSHAPKNGS